MNMFGQKRNTWINTVKLQNFKFLPVRVIYKPFTVLNVFKQIIIQRENKRDLRVCMVHK